MMCHELIERLPLAEILCVKNKNRVNFAKIKKYWDSKLSKINISDGIEEYQNKRFESGTQEREFLEKYNIPVLPITEKLIYSYDYGDGWEVPDVSADILEEVTARHRPVCIAKDGIELVDDVGGIGGFCRMLQTIYEADMDDEEEWEERLVQSRHYRRISYTL